VRGYAFGEADRLVLTRKLTLRTTEAVLGCAGIDAKAAHALRVRGVV